MTNESVNQSEDVYFYDLSEHYLGSIFNIGTFVFKSSYIPSSVDIAKDIIDKDSKNYLSFVRYYDYVKDAPYVQISDSHKIYVVNIRKVNI